MDVFYVEFLERGKGVFLGRGVRKRWVGLFLFGWVKRLVWCV